MYRCNYEPIAPGLWFVDDRRPHLGFIPNGHLGAIESKGPRGGTSIFYDTYLGNERCLVKNQTPVTRCCVRSTSPRTRHDATGREGCGGGAGIRFIRKPYRAVAFGSSSSSVGGRQTSAPRTHPRTQTTNGRGICSTGRCKSRR